MPTDLERFTAQDGRAEAIAEVRRKIDEAGVSYLYFQFVSVTGRVMGKGVPAAHWESTQTRQNQDRYPERAVASLPSHRSCPALPIDWHQTEGIETSAQRRDRAEVPLVSGQDLVGVVPIRQDRVHRVRDADFEVTVPGNEAPGSTQIIKV